jgi:hypothetical protein
MSLGYCSECGESYGHRDYCARNKPTYAELEQQLANLEKQIVMLRSVVEMSFAPNREKALAATQDLSGLVLCDAEPVAKWYGTSWSDVPDGEPLYKARKQP